MRVLAVKTPAPQFATAQTDVINLTFAHFHGNRPCWENGSRRFNDIHEANSATATMIDAIAGDGRLMRLVDVAFYRNKAPLPQGQTGNPEQPSGWLVDAGRRRQTWRFCRSPQTGSACPRRLHVRDVDVQVANRVDLEFLPRLLALNRLPS